MALTQITTNGIKDGTITGTDLTTNVDFVDNQKLRLGTGNDLQIYHDGSNSYVIDNGTGDLRLQTQGGHVRINYGTDDMAVFQPSGFVKLYHNNSVKFETTSTGVEAQGNIITDSGNISILNDTGKFSAGTSQDLNIYHNGTDSIIDNNTNNLEIVTQNSMLFKTADAENAIICNKHGSTDLYYDNSKKFETTSGGAIVTGTLDITGTFSSAGNIKTGTDTGKFFAGASNDLQIYHDGSHSYIKDAGTGNLVIQTNVLGIQSANGLEDLAKFSQDGAVELYYDGSKKFETMSTGAYVEGYLAFPDNGGLKIGSGNDLQIFHDGSDSYIRNTTNTDLIIHNQGNAGIQIKPQNSYPVELYYNASKKFETTSGGVLIANGSISSAPAGNGTASGVSLDTTGGDIFTGRVFIQGANKSANTDYLTGFNNEGSNLVLYDYNNAKYLQKWQKNGSVELYHNGTKTFETDSTGINVFGTSGNGIIDIVPVGSAVYSILNFHNVGQSSNAQIISVSGSNILMGSGGSGSVTLRTANSQNKVVCNHDGSVDLYHGSSKKFETTSVGATVTSGGNSTFKIQPGGSDVYATLTFNNSSGTGVASIGTHAGASTIYYVSPTHLFHIGGGYKLQMSGNSMQPYSGVTNFDLGASGARFNNIYTSDLDLSNEAKGGNDVDGTWGSYTIQEGAEDLFLINKRSGKKYKFNLTEVS
jgi:hypothetical protein